MRLCSSYIPLSNGIMDSASEIWGWNLPVYWGLTPIPQERDPQTRHRRRKRWASFAPSHRASLGSVLRRMRLASLVPVSTIIAPGLVISVDKDWRLVVESLQVFLEWEVSGDNSKPDSAKISCQGFTHI